MNEELKKALDLWGKETVAKIIQSIERGGLVSSGVLRRSIIYQIGEDNIQFLMADYGKFFDQPGDAPKFNKSHRGALAFHLKDWSNKKGLNRWAVATAIVKRGGLKKKPIGFFSQVIEREIEKLTPYIDEAVLQYIDNRIEILNRENT